MICPHPKSTFFTYTTLFFFYFKITPFIFFPSFFFFFFFFFNDPPPPEISPLPLHAPFPIPRRPAGRSPGRPPPGASRSPPRSARSSWMIGAAVGRRAGSRCAPASRGVDRRGLPAPVLQREIGRAHV